MNADEHNFGWGARSRASVLERGSPLFPLPTSLRPACSSRERRSKACHPERSLRSEGPHNIPQNVLLSQGTLEADDLPSLEGKCTLAPSVHAFIGVGLVRPREVLRSEDFAQDDKTGAPLRPPSPVADLAGEGKGNLPLSHGMRPPTASRLRVANSTLIPKPEPGISLAPTARPHCSLGHRPRSPRPQRIRAESPQQAPFQNPCFGLSALSRSLPEVLARWARLQCGRAFGPDFARIVALSSQNATP